jgi:hypothetical protein
MKGDENVVVRIADTEPAPVPVLEDEACKMLDDLSRQLQLAETDDERFWLCCAMSACEQLYATLIAHRGQHCNRWRTARQVALDAFGRMPQLTNPSHPKGYRVIDRRGRDGGDSA